MQPLIESNHNRALKLPFEEAERATCAPARNPYLKRLDEFAKSKLNESSLNLISLFCGGGGLDLGLGFAGFKSLAVSDITPAFVETVTTNLPHAQGLVIDAMELTAEQLQEKAGTKDIDLVAAGPPCQAFSVLGRRGALDDPRGKLALKYFSLVAEIKPKAFLFENVPGLISVNKGEDWKKLLAYAKDITGYHLQSTKLNAARFGIPQHRERVIVVGFREDVAFQFPDKPSGIGAQEFLKDGRALSPSRWALEEVTGLPNHVIRPHGAKVSQRYAAIPQGGRDKIDHTDRIDPTRPSRTVLVGSSAGGGRPHIHPDEHRVITVREAARLQSFPDWYSFCGASTAQYRQTGNAVPPLLAYEIGRAIFQSLKQF